jgi:hypothetical protein
MSAYEPRHEAQPPRARPPPPGRRLAGHHSDLPDALLAYAGARCVHRARALRIRRGYARPIPAAGGRDQAVRGILAALQGFLGQDVEMRRAANGRDWCRLPVAVREGDATTWVTVAVFEEKAQALAGSAEAPRFISRAR